MEQAFPQKNCLVQALFDFQPQEPGELGFKRGDIITGTWGEHGLLSYAFLRFSSQPRRRELVGGPVEQPEGHSAGYLRVPL